MSGIRYVTTESHIHQYTKNLPHDQTQANNHKYIIIHIPNPSSYTWKEPQHVYNHLCRNHAARQNLIEDATHACKFHKQAIYTSHPMLPLPIPISAFTTDNDLLADINNVREFVHAHLNPTIIPPISVHFIHRKLMNKSYYSLIQSLFPDSIY